MKKWIEKFQRVFAAVAFAEANCHDMALEMLQNTEGKSEQKSLSIFLENVGLSNVRVCYVTAQV